MDGLPRPEAQLLTVMEGQCKARIYNVPGNDVVKEKAKSKAAELQAFKIYTDKRVSLWLKIDHE